MKTKRFIKRGAPLLLAAISAVGVAGAFGCGGGGVKVSKDPKTVNVRYFKGGYGVDWIYELKAKFEAAYADEGYKINIVNPSSDMRGSVAISEMAQGYDSTGIDLYVTGDIMPDDVDEDGEYGLLVEDITESVYNQKAIKFDGTEEDQTVSQKIDDAEEAYGRADNGKMYGMPYYSTAAGLVVNTKKLAKYGLELPKTTDELFDCFDKIYRGHNGMKDSTVSKIWPMTYVPGTTNGYSTCWVMPAIAQYDYNAFEEFVSLQEDGTGANMKTDGYEIYNTKAVEEMLNVLYRAYDTEIACAGTTTQGLDQAQSKIMMTQQGAVFMSNGDWMLNEVAMNFKNYINDIDFINYPVVSALGTKLFGEGTSYNITDAAECDALLSYIIDLVDEWKTIDEIVAAVQANKSITITAEDAQAVATARGIYYGRGVEHQCYITKGSSKKDIASLFLRMMASDECAVTVSKYARGSSPFSNIVNTFSGYKFVESASKVTSNPYAKMIKGTPIGYKKQCEGIREQFNSIGHITSYISQQSITMYEDGTFKSGYNNWRDGASLYSAAAKAMQQSEYTFSKSRWSEWVV